MALRGPALVGLVPAHPTDAPLCQFDRRTLWFSLSKLGVSVVQSSCHVPRGVRWRLRDPGCAWGTQAGAVQPRSGAAQPGLASPPSGAPGAMPGSPLPTNFCGVERLRLVRLLASRSMNAGRSADGCSMESGTISRSRISSPAETRESCSAHGKGRGGTATPHPGDPAAPLPGTKTSNADTPPGREVCAPRLWAAAFFPGQVLGHGAKAPAAVTRCWEPRAPRSWAPPAAPCHPM